MADTDNISFEQLWYTWSEKGLGSLDAGFRIRAASGDLAKIYTGRVKSIERHMNYVLPPGTDRYAIAGAANIAPVCLAYLLSGQPGAPPEYILLRKEYIGADGTGRLGNFFVHLIARGNDRGSYFIDDTIALWESKWPPNDGPPNAAQPKDQIWRSSDSGLEDWHTTNLDYITLEALDQQANLFTDDYAKLGRCLKIPPAMRNAETKQFIETYDPLREFLPFLIEAFLTRKDLNTPIYIAAPVSKMRMIVDLIYGLIMCLPLPLLENFTFSTYEADINKLPKPAPLIVGTSWIDLPGLPVPPQVSTEQFFQQYLAINCDTKKYSRLDGRPEVIKKDHVKDFAQHGLQWLLGGDEREPRFYRLRHEAENDKQLKEAKPESKIDLFMVLYDQIFNGSKNYTQDQIIGYLNDENQRSKKLSESDFQRSMIRQAPTNPTFFDQLKRILGFLRKLAPQESIPAPAPRPSNQRSSPTQGRRRTARPESKRISLSAALMSLVQNIITHNIETSISYYEGGVTFKDAGKVLKTSLEMIETSTIPTEAHNVVQDLFKGILQDDKAYHFWISDAKLLTLLFKFTINMLASQKENLDEVIRKLLKDFHDNTNVYNLLTSDWLLLKSLLDFAKHLPGQQEDLLVISPFLNKIPWSHLGVFLALDPPLQWKVIVILRLVKDTSLTKDVAGSLKKDYSAAINTLLQQLQGADGLLWASVDFAVRLAEQGYREALQTLLQAIVSSNVPPNLHQVVRELLTYIRDTRNLYNFLTSDWLLLKSLLDFAKVLPGQQEDLEIVRPFLQNVPWPHLNEFLTLDLYRQQWQWIVIVISRLAKSKPLNKEEAQSLAQLPKGTITKLISQLLIEQEERKIGLAFCGLLIRYGYPYRDDFVPILHKHLSLDKVFAIVYPELEDRLNSFDYIVAYYRHVSASIETLRDLYIELRPYDNKMARLSTLLKALSSETQENILKILDVAELEFPQERVEFIRDYGQAYLQGYLQSPGLAKYIIKLYKQLADRRYTEQQALGFTLFEWAITYDHREELLSLTAPSIEGCAYFFTKYGKQENVIPFFRQSPIVLTWFNTLSQPQNQQSFPAQKKMDILVRWLPELTSGQSFKQLRNKPTPEEAGSILEAAILTLPEQKYFLERRGESYFLDLKDLPLFKEYVIRYASAFTANDLKRPEATRFLTYLNKYIYTLKLHQDITKRLASWQIIYDYMKAPDANQLEQLASAVFSLQLQNDAAFVTDLINTFITCINKPSHLQRIIELFSGIKKGQQLLYDIAEQSAETHRTNIDPLRSYVWFILSHSQKTNPLDNHRTLVFLDILLQYVPVNATAAWKKLDKFVNSQPALKDAYPQWRLYLKGLDIRIPDAQWLRLSRRWTQLISRFRRPQPNPTPATTQPLAEHQLPEPDQLVKDLLNASNEYANKYNMRPTLIQHFIKVKRDFKGKQNLEKYIYSMGEYIAEARCSDEKVLSSYIVFILDLIDEEKDNYAKQGKNVQHMIQVFLDALLEHIPPVESQIWTKLDGCMNNQDPSDFARFQWNEYLVRLNLIINSQDQTSDSRLRTITNPLLRHANTDR